MVGGQWAEMLILQIDTSHLNCLVTADLSLINAIVFIPHQTAQGEA